MQFASLAQEIRFALRRRVWGRLPHLLLPLLLGGACAPLSGRSAAPPGHPEQEITGLLVESAERWNQGDLEGFLEPYLNSPGITFSGGSDVVRGKEAVEARYRRSYWKDGAPSQTLRFTDLEVRPLGSQHALALGRYRLFDGAGTQVAEGPFSLVLVRTREGWRIVHDHSS